MQSWGSSHPHPRAPRATCSPKGCSAPDAPSRRTERQRSGAQGPSQLWDKNQATCNHGEEHLPTQEATARDTGTVTVVISGSQRGIWRKSSQENRSSW